MKILNLTKTTLALLVSLAVVNTSQAGGPTRTNGLRLNGLSLNGTSPNGASLKGPTQDGINGFVVRDVVLPDDGQRGDRDAVYRRPGRPR
ncbi:MAG TPA: hypothetical protein PK018_10655 [Candidatus Competibacter sp.]|nr:hypothetical protein [Candidatus Competibacteraceae bacterium]HPE72607.1 hypothetical protein [Candidatus Competibacter sp.]